MIPTNQLVNKIGKYIYNNLDGAYKFKTSSNMCDVYITVLYQIPYWNRIPGKGKEYNDVHEMTIDLNITTYQNKVRVNLIEMTPEEKTVGYDLFKPEVLYDPEYAMTMIFDRVKKRLAKAFEDYDFLF